MNILLARPKPANIISRINVIDLEPLELEYLYTVAKQEECSCEIHDGLFDQRGPEDVIRKLKPEIVAITGYITQVNAIRDLSKRVKTLNPEITVVVGGVHAELNYADFQIPTVDFVIHSSGVEPFRKIIRLCKSLGSPEDIKGITYRKPDQGWVCNEREVLDPNQLPIPDRSHFNSHKQHYRYLGYSPCAIVKTSYGCPYQCSFCYCRHMNGGTYIVRDIEAVVREIEGIDCENIHIVDDTFFVDRKRVEFFIGMIKEKGIRKKFIAYSRADFVANHEDLIGKLAEIGFEGIITGLEAINDEKLDNFRKQSSDEVNRSCVAILKKHRIECLALFIIDIDADAKDFRNLFQWIRRMDLKYASVSIFTPIPGTVEYEKHKDRLTTGNLEYWDFLHLVLEPARMSKNRFYLEYYKLFIKLFILGRKKGIYDFVDTGYVLSLARSHIREMLKI